MRRPIESSADVAEMAVSIANAARGFAVNNQTNYLVARIAIAPARSRALANEAKKLFTTSKQW